MNASEHIKYSILGLMSGTSLDGLDLAYIHFQRRGNGWAYTIQAAETMAYSEDWTVKLRAAEHYAGRELMRLHSAYGVYLGECVRHFLKKRRLENPTLVASHGHTLFHEPHLGMTFQLGSGAALAAASGLLVASDFRSVDVGLGGQGAPLVPIGDLFLFGQYGACVNLGGIANISFDRDGKRIAFDVCAMNLVMNALSAKLGRAYDAGGALARRGRVREELLTKLNALSYYKKVAPKSLGREDVLRDVMPLLEETDCSIEDQLCTFTEHVAQQLAVVLEELSDAKQGVLITGGGAYHSFLLERLRTYSSCAIVVPDAQTIEFKEALIFGWLGLARWLEETNTLASVTGASRNSCGGALYTGK